MTGQLIRKGERKWLVRIFRGRNSKTGKKKYFSKLVNGNKKDAQTFLTKILRDIDQGTFVDPTPMSLDDYLNRWFEAAARPRLAPNTFEQYEEIIERYVRPVLGSHRLSDLRVLDVQKLYSEMQQRGLSARVVRYTHAVLNSALKQAVRWELIARNPASLVELPKVQRREMQSLTYEQATSFLRNVEADRFSVFFKLAIVTGMRPSECLGLQWKDINFETGVVTIQRTLQWKRAGTWYFGEPKTSKSRRNIPLDRMAVALKEHKRRQAEERLKAGAEYEQLDLVFATKDGHPLRPHNLIVRHFKPMLKSAGISSSVRLYDLRHSCATLLLEEGENPKVVSERLGHSSVVITLDTYSHVLRTMQKRASEKLEKMLLASS